MLYIGLEDTFVKERLMPDLSGVSLKSSPSFLARLASSMAEFLEIFVSLAAVSRAPTAGFPNFWPT